MYTEKDILSKMKSLERENLPLLDDDYQREELMALYNDIRSEIKQASPEMKNIIYDYAALLQEELDLYCPYKAFEAGAVFGTSPNSCNENKKRAFKQYVRQIECDPASIDSHRRVQIKYDMIHELLNNTHGLIDEFNEVYRNCYGVIQENIEVFFDMGYATTCFENS